MRRAMPFLVLVCLAAGPAVYAKFGMSKTRLTLPRTRPPEIPILAAKVFLDVRSDSPEVRGAYVDIVRDRITEALERAELYRLVDQPRESQASVKVSLSALSAEVRDEIRTEVKYVKIGERQEWDAKKNKYVYKDVWGNREFLVTWRLAEGRLSARVSVDDGRDKRSSDASASYSQSFKSDDGIPAEARSEESLREFLVRETAERAAGVVAYSQDPVEALLAVNGELKDGNKLAEAGRYEDALARWSSRTLKGDTEAARLHNVGVAHEALAYRQPPDSEGHRRELEEARDFYRKAINQDPDEKYFKDPLERIEVSLGYSEGARRFVEEVEHFRNGGRGSGNAARKGPSRSEDEAVKTSARTSIPTRPAPSNVAVKGTPLRNGSFESNYNFWTLVGKGNVVDDPSRGRVFEAAGGAETILRQEVEVPSAQGGSLSLDYRVVSGHPSVRVVVEYTDGSGEERSSSLEVARRAGTADWSPWTGDLASLRPRPAKVTGVRVVSESGTVRIDNVALNPR